MKVDIENRTILRVLMVVTGFIFILLLAYLVRRELAWFGAAFFLAVALNPAVEFFSTRFPKRSRLLAVGTVMLLILSFFTLIVATVGPPLVEQSEQLVKRGPSYVKEIQKSDNLAGRLSRQYQVVDKLKAEQSHAVSRLSGATSSLVSVVKNAFSGVAAFITILAATLFMLLEGPGWMEKFWQIQPSSRREHNQKLASEMYRAVTGYVTGNVLTSLIAGISSTILLAILGVPYAITLGLIVAVLDFLPLIGATIGAVIVTTVALFSSLSDAIVVAIFFIIYQQFENHVLQPIVYGRTIQMSPLLVIISAIVGASLLGVLGAIVAIPIAASLKILVADYFDRRAVRAAKTA